MLASQIEVQHPVDPIHPLVIPVMALAPQRQEHQLEAVRRFAFRQREQRVDHRSILFPVGLVSVAAAAQVQRPTGAALADLVLGLGVIDQDAPLGWRQSFLRRCP